MPMCQAFGVIQNAWHSTTYLDNVVVAFAQVNGSGILELLHLLQNILYPWQWVWFSFDPFVEFSEVSNNVDITSLLWNYKGWRCPLTIKCVFPDAILASSRVTSGLDTVNVKNNLTHFVEPTRTIKTEAIVEHRIRMLSDGARTQFLHAMTHNLKVVSANIWPYALKHANHLFNALLRTGNDHFPEQLFSKTPACW